MAAMSPKEALVTLYRWPEASLRAVIQLDTLARDQLLEQSKACRLQTSDALQTPVPTVHVESANQAYPIPCHVCGLASARHSQATACHVDRFFCKACRLQELTNLVAPPYSTIPEIETLSPLSKGDQNHVYRYTTTAT